MSEEPEAYTIGWQPFLGLKIWLDSRPLIPRPETEWWTEQLLQECGGVGLSEPLGGGAAGQFASRREAASKFAPPRASALGGRAKRRVPRESDASALRFLDLCAGSGAIGCAALKYLSHAEVWFGEVDRGHEATIKKNVAENHLDGSRAHVHIGDLFAPFPADFKFDIIATNPPYVPEGRELPAGVTDYEPAFALRAGSDGLALIRRIAAELPGRLSPDGTAWVECDSAHAETARELFAARGFSARIMHDQYGRPRVIRVAHSVQ